MYGSTKEYAEWIAGEINAEVYEIKKIKKINFADYDTIIFGSYLFAFSLPVSKMIIQNWNKIKNKNVIVFTSSSMKPDKDLRMIQLLCKKGLPTEIIGKIKFFHLPGRYLINKFSFIHRLMISMGSMMIKKPEDRKEMLSSFDGVKKENIKELVDFIRNSGKKLT